MSGLAVSLGDIKLKNPVVTCSGTFGSGIEFNRFYDIAKLGAVTTKSYTLKEKKGNKPPRLCETYCGLINSIGLQNEGIDYFLKKDLEDVKALQADIILSISGTDRAEFIAIAEKLIDYRQHFIAVELNFSCPNIKKGGMILGSSASDVESITSSLSGILSIPLIVKLSPIIDDLSAIAQRAKRGGAQAVSLINTMPAMAIDTDTFAPKLGNIMGGLSGPGLKPIAVAKTYKLCKQKILPVIGMGGIYSPLDAIEFMIAGASAVGIGTANFIDVNAAFKVLEGISAYLKEKNIENINQIIGSVRLG